MKRRSFIAAAAAAPVGMMFAQGGSTGQFELPKDVGPALEEFRKSIPSNFDQDYVQHAVIPFFLTSIFEAERPMLPMIDFTLTKENALPFDLWGLIYKEWQPTPEEGVTVFLQGLEQRGEHNLRKRIYFSAVTPDLYHTKYQAKVVSFFDRLMDPQFAGKPFMRHYLDYYFDLYWDLHVGVKGAAIPAEVRLIGESFNTVLAYRNPMEPIVYEHYMKVRANLDFLKKWIADRVDDVAAGRVQDADKTFVHYWLKNAGDGSHFSRKDVVFEAFHNFVALSQWGNTIFGIMSRLSTDGGKADVRASFTKTMSNPANSTVVAGSPYTPLDLFAMELFRTISPNGGSLSAVVDARDSMFGQSPFAKLRAKYERHSYASTPHTETSFDPRQWKNPTAFDPERYKTVPTSAQVDDAKCQAVGLPKCPFDHTSFKVADGRNVDITNSGFGTVFGVVDGKPMPVCDHAGFAPFGFGYRRCPGEQLTIMVFEDFLRKVWKDKIQFASLKLPNPQKVPGRSRRCDRRRHRLHARVDDPSNAGRRDRQRNEPPADRRWLVESSQPSVRLRRHGLARVLCCPLECVVSHFLPPILPKDVVRPTLEFLVVGQGLRLRVVELVRRLHDRRRRDVILVARDEQQRRTRVVVEVHGRHRVRIEVRQPGLEQHMIRPRHRVALEDLERFLFAQRIAERIVELFRCERHGAMVVQRIAERRERYLER